MKFDGNIEMINKLIYLTNEDKIKWIENCIFYKTEVNNYLIAVTNEKYWFNKYIHIIEAPPITRVHIYNTLEARYKDYSKTFIDIHKDYSKIFINIDDIEKINNLVSIKIDNKLLKAIKKQKKKENKEEEKERECSKDKILKGFIEEIEK